MYNITDITFIVIVTEAIHYCLYLCVSFRYAMKQFLHFLLLEIAIYLFSS